MKPFDVAIVGGGAMGCSTALALGRAGRSVVLLERGGLCGEASGVNAGTLTMQMTRAALVPYALRAWKLWMEAPAWLGLDVGARVRDGLSVAFTEGEVALLQERAAARRAAGAPIELVGGNRAREIEPALSDQALMAGFCAIDGFASAYLAGRAFAKALAAAGVTVCERSEVLGAEREGGVFRLRTASAEVKAAQLVLAGGVWLEPMAAWFGIRLPVRVLVNQLIVTERLPPVMRTQLGIANGMLSLKQFENGTVLIGGGWQGVGSRGDGRGERFIPANMVGNMRLAAFAIPALRRARAVRAWLGLEAKTADELPVLGPIPGLDGAWMIGASHSGFMSAPFMGKLLADALLGRAPELPLFPPARLLSKDAA